MKQLGLDKKIHLVNPESKQNVGISFSEFSESMNKRLGDKESKEGARRIFDLFVDDPKA